MSDVPRRAELRDRLAALEQRLAAACRDAGRSRGELTLVAVTKTFPAADVVALAALGITDVGENRDQEARSKAADVAAAGVTTLRWHLVGRLQRNKARSVATYADVVHSVDRPELVRALDDGAARAGRRLRVLVQVSLDPRPADPADPNARGGLAPERAPALADAVAAAAHLDLGGVMAVAPPGGDPDEAFGRLAAVAAELRARHPRAVDVSAGMSGDLEAAIRHGATHVRVGTALLGTRPPLG